MFAGVQRLVRIRARSLVERPAGAVEIGKSSIVRHGNPPPRRAKSRSAKAPSTTRSKTEGAGAPTGASRVAGESRRAPGGADQRKQRGPRRYLSAAIKRGIPERADVRCPCDLRQIVGEKLPTATPLGNGAGGASSDIDGDGNGRERRDADGGAGLQTHQHTATTKSVAEKELFPDPDGDPRDGEQASARTATSAPPRSAQARTSAAGIANGRRPCERRLAGDAARARQVRDEFPPRQRVERLARPARRRPRTSRGTIARRAGAQRCRHPGACEQIREAVLVDVARLGRGLGGKHRATYSTSPLRRSERPIASTSSAVISARRARGTNSRARQRPAGRDAARSA